MMITADLCFQWTLHSFWSHSAVLCPKCLNYLYIGVMFLLCRSWLFSYLVIFPLPEHLKNVLSSLFTPPLPVLLFDLSRLSEFWGICFAPWSFLQLQILVTLLFCFCLCYNISTKPVVASGFLLKTVFVKIIFCGLCYISFGIPVFLLGLNFWYFTDNGLFLQRVDLTIVVLCHQSVGFVAISTDQVCKLSLLWHK